MQRYFDEVAAHLERNVLPRVERKTPHLDLTGNGTPRIAEYVGATSEEAAAEAPIESPVDSGNGSLMDHRGSRR